MKTGKIKPDLIGLTELREAFGFNQELMAMYLKVNLSTLKMAEVGLRPLPTYALIKVAELEISLAAQSRKIRYKHIHPAEKACLYSFESQYNDFVSKEKKCEYKLMLLESQLKLMVDRYQKTRERLKVIEAVMLENEGGQFDTEAWQQQKETAINLLNKCALPGQVLLKSRIAVMYAEIELCKKTRQQIRAALPELFTEHDETSTSLYSNSFYNHQKQTP